MTQNIIEMARQAGFETMFRKGRIHGFERDGDYTEELENFAKLVEDAAFKRWAAQTKLAVQDERDACAKLCDRAHPNTLPAMLGMQIRARGENT